MKLYGFGQSRSLRVLWALNEIEAEFEFITVNLYAAEHRQPEFRRLNPVGRVPVLVDDDIVVTESMAILMYLGEKFPAKGLLPSDLKNRAQVLRWAMFAATELEQPLWRIRKHSLLYPKDKRSPQEIELARQDFKYMAEILDRHMEERHFIVGDGLTIADCATAYVIDWAGEEKLLDGLPNLIAYLDRMYARPKAPKRMAQARPVSQGGYSRPT
jgi:glutathione S-transferase